MNRRELIWLIVSGCVVISFFFYKTFLNGLVPFPGDLLVSEYKPWQTESYLGYNPGSIPNKAQYPDTLRQLYPWRTLSTKIFRSGQIPLWNPHNFSGTPLLANFQSAVFYPLNFLYLILPQITAWTILVILQPFLGLFFTYLYCRKLNLSSLASWLAASAFAFSAFMTVWLEYNTIGQVIIWLPGALLAFECLNKKFSTLWYLVFLTTIVFSLLAGHPQLAFYLILFVLAYAWFRRQNPKSFLLTVGLVIIGTGVASLQLIPGIELITQAARSPHDLTFYFNKILIQPWQLVMLAVPDFFGNPATRNYWLGDTYVGKVTSIGIISLVFVILALKSLLKEKIVQFYFMISLIVLLLITANPLSLLIFRLPLPILSTSSPTLMIFILTFSLAVLAGYGLDYLQKKPTILAVWRVLMPLTILISLLWAGLFAAKFYPGDWSTNVLIAKRNLTLESLLLMAGALCLVAIAKKSKFKNIFLGLIMVINLLDLFFLFRKFNPFVPKALVFPPADVLNFLNKNGGIDRFWGHGAANIEANFATQYSLFSPNGYDPLYPRRYGEFIQSAKDGKIHTLFSDQTRSDATLVSSFGDEDLKNNSARLRLLDVLGVKYVLDRAENASTEKGFPPNRFAHLWSQNGWLVYQNLKAAPRFFLTSDYKTFSNNEEFENIFFDPAFNTAETILLEKQPPALGKPGSKDSVILLSYQPNESVFQAKTESPRLFFLSDTYYPGWLVTVDGRSTEIFRADYAFRAVLVPSGEHVVRFIFRPLSFTIGLGISLLSLVVAVLVPIFRKFKNYA